MMNIDYSLYEEEYENSDIDEVRKKRHRSSKKLSYTKHKVLKESKRNGTKYPKKHKRNRSR